MYKLMYKYIYVHTSVQLSSGLREGGPEKPGERSTPEHNFLKAELFFYWILSKLNLKFLNYR